MPLKSRPVAPPTGGRRWGIPMNFLAHLFLADNTPQSMLGNLLPDFIKGNVHRKFPPEVIQGMMNHRTVDLLTDSSAIVSASKKLISEPRSRLSGVIIDVVYDHFLYRNWKLYSKTDVHEFITTAYDNLLRHGVEIPQRAELIIEKLIQENWLGAYGTMEGIDGTFKRMSKRLRSENMLDSAVEELEAHYTALNAHFLEFFPQLIRQVGEKQDPDSRQNHRGMTK